VPRRKFRFWHKITAPSSKPNFFYERYETAQDVFWWFNQATNARYGATPKPHYGLRRQQGVHRARLDGNAIWTTRFLGPFPSSRSGNRVRGLASKRLDRRRYPRSLLRRKKTQPHTDAVLPAATWTTIPAPRSSRPRARSREVDAAGRTGDRTPPKEIGANRFVAVPVNTD